MVFILISNHCHAILSVFDDLNAAVQTAYATYEGCDIIYRNEILFNVMQKGKLVATIHHRTVSKAAITGSKID